MTEEAGPVKVGVLKETFPGEHRVALIPASVPALQKAGLEVLIEAGAGKDAGFDDSAYTEKAAQILADRNAVFAAADIILQVRAAGANPDASPADFDRLRDGQTVIGLCNPLGQPELMAALASHKVRCFALELLPRITRAQSMDVLSSMASIAGYKTVLMAAETLPRMFPMMMTAAGTITPARVLVVGAGVAGLQAIATARRLGAVVHAYDIRPAVKEEVISLGAKFVELELEADDSAQSGGYAKAMDEEFYRRQRELMARVIADSDVVITTAAVPGKTAPVLVTDAMVEKMSAGSVIVDLAAEQGGNCELTQPGETIVQHGVTIIGTINVPSTVPYHASQMFAKNISTFLLHLVKDGTLVLDREDEIVSSTLVTCDGEVVHAHVRELLRPADVTNQSVTDAVASEATDAQPADNEVETSGPSEDNGTTETEPHATGSSEGEENTHVVE